MTEEHKKNWFFVKATKVLVPLMLIAAGGAAWAYFKGGDLQRARKFIRLARRYAADDLEIRSHWKEIHAAIH